MVQGDDGEEMKCSMSMPVVALLVPFVPPQTDALVRSIHLWSHPNYYPCEVSFTYAQHVDLVFQLTVCPWTMSMCVCLCVCVTVAVSMNTCVIRIAQPFFIPSPQTAFSPLFVCALRMFVVLHNRRASPVMPLCGIVSRTPCDQSCSASEACASCP
mgnify:FL=1